MESESDKLRVKRRSAKGKFTRQVRTVEAMVINARSHSEVYINWETLQRIYEDLQNKHDAFCETIDPKDDAAYESEDEWMEACRETYVKISMSVSDYIRQMKCKDVLDNDKRNDISNVSKGTANVSINGEKNEKMLDTEASHKFQTESEEKSANKGPSDDRSSTFKLQFNQMPKFNGDVREYATFRSDFKDLVEPKCSKRDAITLLRNNLCDKPYELIKGIGNDYSAAWEYLDSVYGDPRVVADAITYDITSFPALEDEEDARFCELCHLVRRSFNTLKDVGRQSDLDNNHMLAIIEQKLSRDDRKVWSRKVEEGNTPATLANLLIWMTVEMKTRMRASALIRDGPTVSRVHHVSSGEVSRVHHVSSREDSNEPRTYEYSEMPPRCWICTSYTHWVDECERFKSMTPSDRVDMIRDNHACYCCLKRAGRNHTSNSCYRRRQCFERNGQDACKQYHHPLLHVSTCNVSNVSCDSGLIGVAGMACNDVMLPVLDAYVLGGNGERKVANILLDSGAQISMVRTQLAKDLGLSGKDTTITINKVGGEEEKLITKRYKLNVQSIDNKNTVTMYVIGIPHITDDIVSISSFSKTARQLKIAVRDIHRGGGPVDILIGIDYPRMHTGETKWVGNVIARKSPLGWVLFGTDDQISASTRVLNVQISKVLGLKDIAKTATSVAAEECLPVADGMSTVERQAAPLNQEVGLQLFDGNRGFIPHPRKRSRGMPDNAQEPQNPKESDGYAKVDDARINVMQNINLTRKLNSDDSSTPNRNTYCVARQAAYVVTDNIAAERGSDIPTRNTMIENMKPATPTSKRNVYVDKMCTSEEDVTVHQRLVNVKEKEVTECVSEFKVSRLYQKSDEVVVKRDIATKRANNVKCDSKLEITEWMSDVKYENVSNGAPVDELPGLGSEDEFKKLKHTEMFDNQESFSTRIVGKDSVRYEIKQDFTTLSKCKCGVTESRLAHFIPSYIPVIVPRLNGYGRSLRLVKSCGSIMNIDITDKIVTLQPIWWMLKDPYDGSCLSKSCNASRPSCNEISCDIVEFTQHSGIKSITGTYNVESL